MSLSNLILNPLNITDLYTELYIKKHIIKPISNESSSTISFIGDNVKKVVVLVKESNFPHIADTDLELLQKILIACGLSITDVAIINIAKQQVTFSTLQQLLQPAVVLMFGVESETLDLPLIFQNYRMQQFTDVQLVKSSPLAFLATNAEERKALWECLKKVFNK